MRLHVVFNKNGDILGAAQVDAKSRIRARPIPDENEGHRAAEVDVPKDYQHLDLASVCEKLRVDVKEKLPSLKPRG